ncbi:SMC-Scp complex subunit ScpB [Thalassotalea euphylliae]|uniref:SMC-Scp complex subunit ScpB n=1 Tax=Thalassotalea euphylliae TaxID=1655234 RepID=UPI0036447399
MKLGLLKQVIEAYLFSTDSSVSAKQMKQRLFSDDGVTTKQIKRALEELMREYQERGVNLVEVGAGYRFQTNEAVKDKLLMAQRDKPQKVTNAMLETLATIAYKQPITRSEIEEIRGVAVSSYIIKSLTERQWIKITGHREVPGRPALFSTTTTFLSYFGLTSLSQLPEVLPINQADNVENVIEASETEA